MIKPKKSVESISGYDIPLFLDTSIVKLDSNENIMGPSSKVLDALKNIEQTDIQYYPAYGELINHIAQYNSVENSMILPTNGADDALKLIIDTFIDAHNSILAVTPSFVMPKIYSKSAGCEYKEIKYKQKWVFPVDEVIENINIKTKLIIVTTPNNPTGEAVSRDNLVKIIESAPNILILVDETYSNYAKDNFTDLALKYSNVIITRSMSKDFALAGLRLGYILSHPENILNLKKIMSPYNVNVVAAIAGIVALNDLAYMEFVKSEVEESRRILKEAFKPLAQEIFESEANFLLVDFGSSADFIHRKLLNAGILVKSFASNSELRTCLRVTLPNSEVARRISEKLKPKELLIFDMDGVIVDTRNSYRLAIKGTYEHFSGKELTPEDIQHAKNQGGLNNDWDLTEFLLRKSGIIADFQEIVNKFQELYFGQNGSGFIQNETMIISRESLLNLSKTYDMAIFTGRPKLEAEFALQRWNLEELFFPVITMDDIPKEFHKPDPYGVNYILDIVKPSTSYYLGDTVDDMIAAQQANVLGIGVLPPQDKSEDLLNRLNSAGAFEVLDDTEKIIDFLGILS